MGGQAVGAESRQTGRESEIAVSPDRPRKRRTCERTRVPRGARLFPLERKKIGAVGGTGVAEALQALKQEQARQGQEQSGTK